MTKHYKSWPILLVATGLVLTACGQATPTPGASPTTGGSSEPTATGSTSGRNERVRFALDWTPNTNHTGIYVAMEKGWYRDAGIDLQILPYSDANIPDTLVGTGQADFGVSSTEAVVYDRINNLPVKSVAAVLQTNTSSLVTLKSSGLDRPAKLEGKRYAGFGTPYEEPVISTMIKHDGGVTGQFKLITANLFGYEAVTAGQADFVWIFEGWQTIQAKLEGVELNSFLIKDYGVPDYYTPVIIGAESFLKDKPDVARRFLDATARGYEYGITNPKDAAQLLIEAAPQGTFPDPRLPEQSQEYLVPYFKGDQPRWGLQTLKMWTDYPTFMASTGLLKNSEEKVIKPEDLDFGGMFTNDYLPQK
jgi:ABC-type nitrate/sulfonate/bicarbonate transport system substrate-binding protein